MRVLWFTNTPSNYKQVSNVYNGGGWISSLEKELLARTSLDLGIAFLLNDHPRKVIDGKVCYYPIHNPYSFTFLGKVKRCIISSKKRQDYFIQEYLRVIDDFKPDIINVFGTELDFGLITEYTNIPVVIHLQGLLTPYLTAFFPPGYNLCSFVWQDLNVLSAIRRYISYLSFKSNAEREVDIFRCNQHFLGRTEWDKNLTSIYSPHATYDYCSEILRDAFYLPSSHEIPDELTIMTTISSPLYKGFDVVLRCASIMKNEMNMDFEWRVYGNVNPSFFERKENIMCSDVNVQVMGVASQDELKQSLLTSTLYVHPSYIDNSPNSVCEAQMIGCTVVGQNVGGMPSIVNDNETGILVPANDPYQMACAIRDLYANPQKNRLLGDLAKKMALSRHNKKIIVDDLISIYKRYLNVNCCLNS